MKIQLFFIISILKIYIYAIERDPVYRCHDNPYRDEQCLTHEKLGDVDFYWVRKCKGAKVCVKLPYYGNMTGVCSIKVRSHYDGETCQKNNKCTSGICNNNKCKGFDDGHRCQPGLGQCKKGKVCRFNNKDDTFHICTHPIGGGEQCEGFIKYNTDDNDYFNNNDKSYYLPENNICELGYVCSNTKCTLIHSIDNRGTSTNPLACTSGAIYNNTCITYPPSNNTCQNNNTCSITLTGINGQQTVPCLKTSKGAYWCPTSAINLAFTDWYNEWLSKRKDNTDTNLEAYRYTANKKSVNELFFRYKYFGLITDADECAYDYFWKNNSSKKLEFSIIIIIITLVFLF